MIKNKKYSGDLSKKQVVQLFKELKELGNTKRPELMIDECDSYWWYYIDLNVDMIHWDDIKIIAKYSRVSISAVKNSLCQWV